MVVYKDRSEIYDGHSKSDGKELPSVTSICTSSTKQEMLKVKFDNYHTVCAPM